MMVTAKLLIVYMLPERSQRDLHREKQAGRKMHVQQKERTSTHSPSRLQNPVSTSNVLLNYATFFGEEEKK